MKKFLSTIFLSTLLIAKAISQDTLRVPAEYSTIQASIDAALEGDVVFVAPGIYYENIVWPNTHSISLISEFGMDSTIIDGNGTGSVITFNSGIDTTTFIYGFTITNGNARHGGGIYCMNSSPVLKNLKIIGNRADLWDGPSGGGIYCESSSPRIVDVSVVNNTAISFNGTESGAGIMCTFYSSPVLTNVIISDNYCNTEHGNGAGLSISLSEMFFSGGLISKNKAGGCGGIGLSESSLKLTNVIIEGNIATTYGGGGIKSTNSNIEINECDIIENISKGPEHGEGGGIYCNNSSLYLSNVSIRENSAYTIAGGIFFIGNSSVEFDSLKRCSIYLNHAGEHGNDLYSDVLKTLNVFVDTFTVLTSNYYFARGPLNLNIQNSVITQVNQNLFVSPTGSNYNHGLSAEYPLKTISYALSKIISDSTSRRNIFLAEGIYSPVLTGEVFPLNMKSFVSIEGKDLNSTILDGCAQSGVLSLCHDSGILVSNLSIQNGRAAHGGGISCKNSDLIIKNLVIKNNSTHNPHGSDQSGGGIYSLYSDVNLNYALIINNNSFDGGGVCLEHSNIILNNTLIKDNIAAMFGGGIFCRNSDPILTNTTLSRNESEHGGGIFCRASKPTVINSICWGNAPNEIECMWVDVFSTIKISYSDIKGGLGGIVTNDRGYVYWLDGNLDTDPMFRNDYHLMATFCGDSFNSPCIDAGNPIITDKILDCSWGLGTKRSDMGAYGGGDSILVGVKNLEVEIPKEYSLSQNYPNPFNPSTKISWQLPVRSWQTLKVFDLLGREIKTLVNEEREAGYHSIDFNGSELPSGGYFYELKAGSYIESKKMILLK